MAKNHKQALSIMDASWAKFVDMLSYKTVWHDRIVQKVSRFYPSSQTCNCCGYINHARFRGEASPRNSAPEVKDLEVREWHCPKCNAHHLRDWNAAINIRNEGLRLVTVGAPETQNAYGDGVRFEETQAPVVELGITRLQVV